MNEDFSDVTLVTEDKKQIKANVNILSACSPVFKDIFKKENNSSTIMYLRGIQFSEMESIMQFIYLGEATFYEERMDEFLAVAKSLEIKELCNTEMELCNTEMESNDEPEKVSLVRPIGEKQAVTTKSFNNHAHKERKEVASVNSKQSVHDDGVKYACDKCDYQATRKNILNQHIQAKHEGVKYACDQCDYQASYKWDLSTHIQSKHEGLKYACDQCDHQATQQSSLNRHIQSKHEGIRFTCDQCDKQFTGKGNLNKHIQSQHEGVKYDCDQCDYQATQKRYLKTHIHNMHKVVS